MARESAGFRIYALGPVDDLFGAKPSRKRKTSLLGLGSRGEAVVPDGFANTGYLSPDQRFIALGVHDLLV
jgi:hypothetical protein